MIVSGLLMMKCSSKLQCVRDKFPKCRIESWWRQASIQICLSSGMQPGYKFFPIRVLEVVVVVEGSVATWADRTNMVKGEGSSPLINWAQLLAMMDQEVVEEGAIMTTETPGLMVACEIIEMTT